MDAHFMEYHANHRRDDIQREMRAIRIGELARGQRTGRLMRLIRVLFHRANTLAAPTEEPSVSAQRATVKMAR